MKKKILKKGTACSLFFCKVPLLSFDFIIVSVLYTPGFGVGSNKADSQMEELNLRRAAVRPVQHRAGGHLPLVALSLGKLQERIQASRRLEEGQVQYILPF